MALDDKIILLCGLVEIALPGTTIRLTDGGFLDWPARGFFNSQDPVFGTIESVDIPSEAVADESPTGRVTLLPPKLAAAGDLFRSDAQGSAVNMWIAMADRDTGLMIGDPIAQWSMEIDVVGLRIGRTGRFVDIDLISSAERLFMIREGNVMSTPFHQRAYPLEKGFDFTTGAGIQVAWGVAAPGRFTIPFFGGLLNQGPAA